MKYKVKSLQKLKMSLALTLLASGCCVFQSGNALTFPLPSDGDIVGDVQTTTVKEGESLGELGRRFDVGVYEMIEANPNLDPWVPMTGAIAVIPTQFILPKGERKGIVLNLAEMRLYYFHPDKDMVTTHPLGIGKAGWSSPLGQTVIVNKKKDPSWYPPESIRQEHIANGDPLPAVVPAGEDNPLGKYAFYVSVKGLSEKGSYMIHGTNLAGGVGLRSTHGCIRLLPEDIENLYNIVPVGTMVRIVHEPYKVGWSKGHLYLEAHEPISEAKYASANNRDSTTQLQKVITDAIADTHMVNWVGAQMFAKKANGYPIRID